jgi:hypothetical protein
MSTRTLTDYLASLPTVTSNGSEQVPAVKGGDLVNLASQLITEPRSTTTVVAGDAGKLFFSGGQMWRYVDGTEGWDLPVGTPWPVIGYKEFRFEANAGSVGFLTVFKNQLYENTPTLSDRFSNARRFALPTNEPERYTIIQLGFASSSLDNPTTSRGAVQISHINKPLNEISVSSCKFEYAPTNTIVTLGEFGIFSLRQYPPLP